VLLPNEWLLLLFISLSTQYGNFWIHPRIVVLAADVTLSLFTILPEHSIELNMNIVSNPI
jgi:hypothetical protein